MAKKSASKTDSKTANLGFEAKLWLAADKLRNNMDAAEYKHVVLGLIFLKYISDTFDEHYAKLIAGDGDYAGADPEDKDEYLEESSSAVTRIRNSHTLWEWSTMGRSSTSGFHLNCVIRTDGFLILNKANCRVFLRVNRWTSTGISHMYPHLSRGASCCRASAVGSRGWRWRVF